MFARTRACSFIFENATAEFNNAKSDTGLIEGMEDSRLEAIRGKKLHQNREIVAK